MFSKPTLHKRASRLFLLTPQRQHLSTSSSPLHGKASSSLPPSTEQASSGPGDSKDDVASESDSSDTRSAPPEQQQPQQLHPQKPTTQAQLDAELQAKLKQVFGGDQEAGVEYEDGRPVAMKRSVRENMFRLI